MFCLSLCYYFFVSWSSLFVLFYPFFCCLCLHKFSVVIRNSKSFDSVWFRSLNFSTGYSFYSFLDKLFNVSLNFLTFNLNELWFHLVQTKQHWFFVYESYKKLVQLLGYLFPLIALVPTTLKILDSILVKKINDVFINNLFIGGKRLSDGIHYVQCYTKYIWMDILNSIVTFNLILR